MLNKADISAGVKQVYTHRCRFWVGAPLPCVWHRRGRNMFGPLCFLATNTHVATRNQNFRLRYSQNAAKTFLFLVFT